MPPLCRSYGRSSFSQPTQMSHRNRCRVLMGSPSPLTETRQKQHCGLRGPVWFRGYNTYNPFAHPRSRRGCTSPTSLLASPISPSARAHMSFYRRPLSVPSYASSCCTTRVATILHLHMSDSVGSWLFRPLRPSKTLAYASLQALKIRVELPRFIDKPSTGQKNTLFYI